MPNPDPRPTPPARQPAASQGRSRGRRPRPGPPGFTYQVQLLGGEVGRRLAQQQTEAIAAVLAWLATHPPTPAAAAGSAATGVGRPGGRHGDAGRGAAGPAGPAGQWMGARSGGRARAEVSRNPEPNAPGPSGGPGGLEVAGRGRPIRRRCGSRRWGCGGGPADWEVAGGWASTRRRGAAGSGRPGVGGRQQRACPRILTLSRMRVSKDQRHGDREGAGRLKVRVLLGAHP
jgi:hypothetical protein